MSVLERAQKDRAEGRLWKARDRLLGAMAQRPHDSAVVNALAEIYWEMGDQPLAGALWYMTDVESPDAQRAREIFAERWGNRPSKMLLELRLRQDPSTYPTAVKNRLDELIAAAKVDGYEWRAPANREVHIPWNEHPRIRQLQFDLTVAAVVLFFVGVFLFGLVSLIQALV